MPTTSKLVYAAALAVTAGYAIKTRIEAKKAAKSYLAAYAEFREIAIGQDATIDYLCDVLNRNEIEADEFDMIALKYYAD